MLVVEGKDLAVLCVQAPNVGAGPQTEVGMVALGLVDPLPTQVLPKVNVQLPYTAVLLCGAEAVVGIQGSPVPGAVQVLSPFQGVAMRSRKGRFMSWMVPRSPRRLGLIPLISTWSTLSLLSQEQ